MKPHLGTTVTERVAIRYAMGGEDRSDNGTVIEYGVQTMMKGKTPSVAAKDLVKKFHGHENMFFGPGITLLDAKKVEEALWERIVAMAVKGAESFNEEKNHWALSSALNHFEQKITPKMRAELKKRVIKTMGKDPFEHDDGT